MFIEIRFHCEKPKKHIIRIDDIDYLDFKDRTLYLKDKNCYKNLTRRCVFEIKKQLLSKN